MAKKFDYEARCPGCGQLVEKGTRRKSKKRLAFQCPKCTTKFSLTFDNDADDLRRRFEAGEDIDGSGDLWG